MCSSQVNITYETYKSLICHLVYKMTGSVSDAEDIYQELMIKWSQQNVCEIHSPKAWLIKVATRMALDLLKSSKKTKECYIGPWLPEPWLESPYDLEESYQQKESLSIAYLLSLEKLTANERVCFVLHKAFDYSHKEIAKTLNLSTSNCRKYASRAKLKLQDSDHKVSLNCDHHSKIIQQFLEAIQGGNMDQLIQAFSIDVRLHSDGGGKAFAARKILKGLLFIGRFLMKTLKPSLLNQEYNCQFVHFNGALGLVLFKNNQAISAYHFHIENLKIIDIYVHRNPEKLKLFELKHDASRSSFKE